jgi:microcystin-dependent protein
LDDQLNQLNTNSKSDVKFEFDGTKIVPKSLHVAKLHSASFNKTLHFDRIKHVYNEAQFVKNFALTTRTAHRLVPAKKQTYPPMRNMIVIIASNEVNTINFDANGVGLGQYEGWFICNGQNGTPDLRGRFLVSQGVIGNEFERVGQVGGRSRMNLSINEMPKHTHKDKGHAHKVQLKTNSAGEHSHSFNNNNDLDYIKFREGYCNYPRSFRILPSSNWQNTKISGQHSHDVSGSTTINSVDLAEEGGNEDFEILPPYFVVQYIIYLG